MLRKDAMEAAGSLPRRRYRLSHVSAFGDPQGAAPAHIIDRGPPNEARVAPALMSKYADQPTLVPTGTDITPIERFLISLPRVPGADLRTRLAAAPSVRQFAGKAGGGVRQKWIG